MFEFKHPKYYKELRKRNKLAESRQPVVGGQQQSDQVISETTATANGERAPGPGLKVTSSKQQAIDETVPHCDIEEASSNKDQASSVKHQALKLSNQPVQSPSDKHPNQSNKRQASSHKQQAP